MHSQTTFRWWNLSLTFPLSSLEKSRAILRPPIPFLYSSHSTWSVHWLGLRVLPLIARKTLVRSLDSTFDRITRMSTTPDTTTSAGSANVDHQVSDKGKVASWKAHGVVVNRKRNLCRQQIKQWNFKENVMTCPVTSTIKSIMFNFQGKIYRPQALRDKKEVIQFDPRKEYDMQSIPWEVPK